MIVNKIVCDVCGNETESEHPIRFALQKYEQSDGFARCRNAYVNQQHIHVCDECYKNVSKMFGIEE